ncbi:hypothetical protein P5W99_11130 [Paraburkholderia sp. A3BS-1L]|uniref:hypothetical protein n=1 Tax=Paraburkholderia sp. A3BS-1L TaxID=3028375 RepID=UPI003DA8A135
MRYDNLMRDACNEALMESTRVHAALDAIYACCTPAGSLVRSLTVLGLNVDDAALVSKLADWVLNEAPLEPLPMSPSEAAALAERVHKAIGGK